MQVKWIDILRVAVMFTSFGLNLANYYIISYISGKGDKVHSNVNPGNGSTKSSTPVHDQPTNQE